MKIEPKHSLIANAPRAGLILDAGCGEFTYANYVKAMKDFSGTIACLDINVPQKKQAEEYLFSLGSIDKLPYKNNTFDFIYCFSVVQLVVDDRSVIEEFYRVIKPGGKLLITVPTRISPFRVIRDLEIRFNLYKFQEFNVPHHYYYSVNDINNLVDDLFRIECISSYGHNFIPRLLNFCIGFLRQRKRFPKQNYGHGELNIPHNFKINRANVFHEISYHLIILLKKENY